jgi:chemotaxis protein histidine kinase CheA
MAAPPTSREILIAEAIGDLGRLLGRAEALQPSMDESRQELVHAHMQLADQLASFEAQVLALTEKAKVQTVKHVLARTDEAARHAVDAQAQAMAKAAKQLFDSLVDPRLQQLARVVARHVERIDHPWERWCTHAATALASSAATLAIVAHLWPR